jgi:hypothetical protein
MIRNRIKAHCRIRAGDLVPHEFNFRFHPDNQKSALEPCTRKLVSPAASWPTNILAFGCFVPPLFYPCLSVFIRGRFWAS